MLRLSIIIISLLAISPLCLFSQEVVISGFPAGVAGSVDKEFFKDYYPDLQEIADSLKKYPLAKAIIKGSADGESYKENNDAKNAALALGRAHVLNNLMVDKFNVDPKQVFIQSGDSESKGDGYRSVSIRITRDFKEIVIRLDSLANRTPEEKHFTEIKEITIDLPEYMGMKLSAGLTSSPFGAIPIVATSVTWNRTVFIEGLVGHTFWNSSYHFVNQDLRTKRRTVGGQVIVYPFEKTPIGIVGGWIRVEEISRDFYRYVRMSEGPTIGIRASLFDYLNITALYNPSNHHVTDENIYHENNDQFMFTITFYKIFGGGE